MKYLLLASLVISSAAIADCNVKSASQLANEHNVGPIVNLVKTKGMDNCTVEFDITVDGVTHHLKEFEKGLENTESLCYYARERARRNLLMDLPGRFKTESVTTCREGESVSRQVKKGDTILETEVGPSPIKNYFKYHNSRCRLFQEHLVVDRELRSYNGVICQIENSDTNWLVVDKW
jgi:hypothetical protein